MNLEYDESQEKIRYPSCLNVLGLMHKEECLFVLCSYFSDELLSTNMLQHMSFSIQFRMGLFMIVRGISWSLIQ